MARLRAGILSGISGKVSNIVGARAFGIDYIRERVIPANPRTPAQQAQRKMFALVGASLRPFLPLSIRALFRKRAVGMPSWSRAIQQTFALMGPTFDAVDLVVSEGETSPPTSLFVDAGDNDVQIEFDANAPGDDLGTDTVHVAVVDRLSGALIDHQYAQRGVGTVKVTSGVPVDELGKLAILAWAVRGEGTPYAEGSAVAFSARAGAGKAGRAGIQVVRRSLEEPV